MCKTNNKGPRIEPCGKPKIYHINFLAYKGLVSERFWHTGLTEKLTMKQKI